MFCICITFFNINGLIFSLYNLILMMDVFKTDSQTSCKCNSVCQPQHTTRVKIKVQSQSTKFNQSIRSCLKYFYNTDWGISAKGRQEACSLCQSEDLWQKTSRGEREQGEACKGPDGRQGRGVTMEVSDLGDPVRQKNTNQWTLGLP